MIKRFLLVYFLSIFALGSQAASPVSGEYIILVGGPSMYQWEKYKTYPHDHWWANFIRAARIRTEQLRTELGSDAKITRRVFARHAYAKSWGCHTGEEMSKKWYAATGVHMIGAVGKTQYMMEELPVLVSQTDKWVN